MARSHREQKREKEQTALLTERLSQSPALNVTWWITAAFMALFLGALTHWQIFEYDLFFLLRAGSEILATGKVQTTDSWSYTVHGQTWFNFQWLTTVLLELVHRTFDTSGDLYNGFASLSWLRSGLVALWVGIQLLIVRRVCGRSLGAWASCLVIVPWIYVASSFRLQMRPDLFASVAYVLLVMTAVSDSPKWPKWNEKRRRLTALGLLLLFANLHSGTSPLGVIFFSAWIFFSESPWPKKGMWILAAVLTWFATPIGVHVLEVIRDNILQYDYSLTGNPDLQPFTLKLLDRENGGWHLILWVIYSAFAGFFFFSLWGDRKRLPKIYQNFAFTGTLGAVLTLLVFSHIRSIHYQMIFLLPIMAAGAEQFLRVESRKQLWRRGGVFVGLFAFLWLWVVPDHVRYTAKPLGSKLIDSELPVRSVDFIQKNHPKPNIFNAYDFGGYLVGNLPDYPVAYDGREVPFLPIYSSIGSPAFIAQNDVNIALVHFPGTRYNPQTGFSDTDQDRFPKSDWAQVYFDNCSVVYVRRLPANAELIQNFEYKYLRRGLPYNFGASFKGLDDATRQGFERELDRCLADNSTNTYCLAGKAAFHERRKENEQALTLLNRALEWNPKSMEALFELANFDGTLGKSEEAEKLKAEFARYTHPL